MFLKASANGWHAALSDSGVRKDRGTKSIRPLTLFPLQTEICRFTLGTKPLCQLPGHILLDVAEIQNGGSVAEGPGQGRWDTRTAEPRPARTGSASGTANIPIRAGNVWVPDSGAVALHAVLFFWRPHLEAPLRPGFDSPSATNSSPSSFSPPPRIHTHR